jgi:3-oxoacyl-[acyl-carrier-protein] synthase-1
MLVLEEWERARRRGAHIYAELAGYGASSDGDDMVTPLQEGAERAMRLALSGVDESVDYVNTHATSTPAGDQVEVKAMQNVFGKNLPRFSSTKGMSGHSIAASGAQEAVYCLLMMRDGFLAPSINIDKLDPALSGLPVICETQSTRVDVIMSNSFGFGGTNASLVFRRDKS